MLDHARDVGQRPLLRVQPGPLPRLPVWLLRQSAAGHHAKRARNLGVLGCACGGCRRRNGCCGLPAARPAARLSLRPTLPPTRPPFLSTDPGTGRLVQRGLGAALGGRHHCCSGAARPPQHHHLPRAAGQWHAAAAPYTGSPDHDAGAGVLDHLLAACLDCCCWLARLLQRPATAATSSKRMLPIQPGTRASPTTAPAPCLHPRAVQPGVLGAAAGLSRRALLRRCTS